MGQPRGLARVEPVDGHRLVGAVGGRRIAVAFDKLDDDSLDAVIADPNAVTAPALGDHGAVQQQCSHGLRIRRRRDRIERPREQHNREIRRDWGRG